MTDTAAAVEHTPGPWHSAPVGARQAPFDERFMILAFDGPQTLKIGVADGVNREANARLIARAPELLAENERLTALNAVMLAALEAARSFLLMAGERTHEPLLRSVFYEKVDDLDRVLAQARGEKVQGG